MNVDESHKQDSEQDKSDKTDKSMLNLRISVPQKTPQLPLMRRITHGSVRILAKILGLGDCHPREKLCDAWAFHPGSSF